MSECFSDHDISYLRRVVRHNILYIFLLCIPLPFRCLVVKGLDITTLPVRWWPQREREWEPCICFIHVDYIESMLCRSMSNGMQVCTHTMHLQIFIWCIFVWNICKTTLRSLRWRVHCTASYNTLWLLLMPVYYISPDLLVGFPPWLSLNAVAVNHSWHSLGIIYHARLTPVARKRVVVITWVASTCKYTTDSLPSFYWRNWNKLLVRIVCSGKVKCQSNWYCHKWIITFYKHTWKTVHIR